MKRFFLLFKIIFKVGALLFGMCIYALWMVDLYNIMVIDEKPLISVLKEVSSIPPMELIKSYAQNMFFQGEHAESMIFPCIIMSIPLLRLILIVLFKGFAATFAFAMDNLTITYVYKDTGKYAFSETNEASLILLGFSILIRLSIVAVIVNISPFILLVTLPINVLQLLCVKRR